jgi:hypothetical protein
VQRSWSQFYGDRVDTTTGKVTDEFGQTFDLNLTQNTDLLARDYKALDIQGSYRFGTRTTAGGSYTLSQLRGNVNGENIGSGPITSDVLSYPEYFQMPWSFPVGDLAADQRHRARLGQRRSAVERPLRPRLTRRRDPDRARRTAPWEASAPLRVADRCERRWRQRSTFTPRMFHGELYH